MRSAALCAGVHPALAVPTASPQRTALGPRRRPSAARGCSPRRSSFVMPGLMRCHRTPHRGRRSGQSIQDDRSGGTSGEWAEGRAIVALLYTPESCVGSTATATATVNCIFARRARRARRGSVQMTRLNAAARSHFLLGTTQVQLLVGSSVGLSAQISRSPSKHSKSSLQFSASSALSARKCCSLLPLQFSRLPSALSRLIQRLRKPSHTHREQHHREQRQRAELRPQVADADALE